MQSFSTQPLTHHIHNNLFDNPYLLACLLVPHLETYLAVSTNTRFLLLEYPTEHLATVLALQKLVGSEMLKIAGIIDSESASPMTSEGVSPLPVYIAQHSKAVPRNLDTISLPGSPFPNTNNQGRATIAHRRRLSFSRANYLLTSSATDAEIAAFISKIWKVLIDADLFYVPEQPLLQHSAHALAAKPSLPILVSKFTHPCSPPLSPPGLPLPPPPPSSSSRMTRDESPSRASNLSGSVFGRGGQQHIAIVQQQHQQQHQGFDGSMASSSPRSPARPATPRRDTDDYEISFAEEGDFYDAEERRLMPMYVRHSQMRKGNSRKALRWLGLA